MDDSVLWFLGIALRGCFVLKNELTGWTPKNIERKKEKKMFGKLFDFNRDGKTDALEFGLAVSFLEAAEKAVAEEDNEEAMDDEENQELLEQLSALKKELDGLQGELAEIEEKEPGDICSDAYDRWEARRDLLEEQISDVEDEIDELEEALNDNFE